jgi:hypothetical protein
MPLGALRLHNTTGIIGTTVSGTFLYLIALLNPPRPLRRWRHRRRLPAWSGGAGHLEVW